MTDPTFSVPGKHVPIFAAAVQCLGKIGKELYIEMNGEAVCMPRVLSSENRAETNLSGTFVRSSCVP
jgi:hypothetical protein